MKLFLIRHGESTSDVEDRYGGDYNDHLTEKGKKQAKELAEKLSEKKIEIIYSSPRFRAKETAQILNKKLKVKLKIVPGLRERNKYGILTGMKKSEAKKKHPELVKLLDAYKNNITGAESYEHFKKRILKAAKEVLKKDYNVIAIVTHGGPIQCISREILKKEVDHDLGDCEFFEFSIPRFIIENAL